MTQIDSDAPVQILPGGMDFKPLQFVRTPRRTNGGVNVIRLDAIEGLELSDKRTCVVALRGGTRIEIPRAQGGERAFAMIAELLEPATYAAPESEGVPDGEQERSEPEPDGAPARGTASRQPVRRTQQP